MFPLTMFNTHFCRFMRKNHVLDSETCDIYSIWDICPLSRWAKLNQMIHTCRLCRPEWFPFIFWLVLLLAGLGIITSLLEFLRICFCSAYQISMWRDRSYYIFGYSSLRRARFVGSYVMLSAWLLLVYGIIMVSPIYMRPWLMLHAIMIGFEMTTWLAKTILGRLTLELNMIVSLIMPILTHMMVRCVTNVFEEAIRNDVSDSLHVF
ncbi:uncharacterized protein Dwil_GK10154 [Drosophila willistoni]|uniref:Uncharacterized protein n=1 Tax=Drosophila willistoni TaxID=7260 RepID=B4ND36_DROWI|nr:uncharacterized protein LOC6648905 [Drosophila willistoni]EDW82745.2 uncharacterized protein Dwil_GK10154 [Drosophila willistoni]